MTDLVSVYYYGSVDINSEIIDYFMIDEKRKIQESEKARMYRYSMRRPTRIELNRIICKPIYKILKFTIAPIMPQKNTIL